MVLADLGAEVIRVERPNAFDIKDAVLRSRCIVRLDLKKADGVQMCLCLAANPALIYGRMTGWGRVAERVGHQLSSASPAS
jgi:alpha-methylacyl-CoA racemase